jgi:2-methylcitrate dehydratase
MKALMNKVRVIESDELSARYPAAVPCRMTITLAPGESLSTEVEFPKGHRRNPLSDAELEYKFRVMFEEYGEDYHADAILDVLWKFEQIPDIKTFLKLIVRGAVSDSWPNLRH